MAPKRSRRVSPKRRSPKRSRRVSPKRRSPKRRSPKRRSPKRRSPKRKSQTRHRINKVDSNPCSIRNKNTCYYDPNCHWVKGSGCHRRKNVASKEDVYEGPIFQDHLSGVVSYNMRKSRKMSRKSRKMSRKSRKSRKVSRKVSRKSRKVSRK
jgi:hypothetical protein